MADTDTQSIEALEQIAGRMDVQANHYAMLGLPAGAPAADIRDAFFSLAKLLHPDLQVFAAPDLKVKVTKAFQAVSAAHRTLSDPHRRAEYDGQLGLGSVNQLQDAQPNPDLARIYMHRSKQILQQRSWAQAEEGLRVAQELFGPKGNAECDVHLAWAIFNNPDVPQLQRAAESKELLEAVIKLEYGDIVEAQARYYKAIWCKLQDEVPQVRKHLEQCLRLSPRHIEAQRELRLFDRRRKHSDVRKDRKRRGTGNTRRASRTKSTVKTPAAKGHDPSAPIKKVKLAKRKGFFDWLKGD